MSRIQTSFAHPSALPPAENIFFPSSAPPSASSPYVLFIPGNPGLVAYYTTFLTTLSSLLPSPILGVSLSGFHPCQPSARDSAPRYWTLQEQVTHKLALTQSIAANHGWKKVIIVAHSVGAYIAQEVIRRLRDEGAENANVEVVGGVLLFPTIVDIARSPSGMVLSSLLKYLPSLPSLASAASRALTTAMPTAFLRRTIELVASQPPDAAATTATFLSTPGMVFQSLALARDEMRTITHDAWGAEVWENADCPLALYFAEKDHWVADQTRDGILKTRGSAARIMICRDGLPHGFSHGEVMAEKVALWVGELVGE